MSSLLYMLGRAAYRARSWVLAAWLVALVLLLAGAGLLSNGTDNTFSIPGTESQKAQDSLARTFPEVSGTSAQLVAVAPKGTDVHDPAFQSAVESSAAAIAKIPQVTSASSPYIGPSTGNIAADGSAVIVPIQLSVAQTAVLPATADALQTAGRDLETALPTGSEVAVGGQLFAQTVAGISVTELLGIVVAFAVLIATFASVIAASLPLITALLGAGMSLSLIFAATHWLTIASTTPLLALMLGLAVGIDYALFIISRHQEQLKQGVEPEESAARSVATAGSAVVFAAVTVIIALVGLSVAGIPFLTTMGVAAALAVTLAVLISMTLTPALLGFAGMRVVAKRYRKAAAAAPAESEDAAATDDTAEAGGDAEESEPPDESAAESAAPPPERAPEPTPEPKRPRREHPVATAWVRTVTRIPILTVVLVVALLALVALPAASLRLALPDADYAIAADGARAGASGTFDARVPRGGAVVLTGPGHTALASAIAGRAPLEAGRVKVDGLLLPVRRSSVRSRAAIARLDRTRDAVAAVRDAMSDRPVVLVVDGAEAVTGAERAALAGQLARVTAGGTALVLAATSPASVADLLPTGTDTDPPTPRTRREPIP